MPSGPRSLQQTTRFQRELAEVLAAHERAEAAFSGFAHIVTRRPDLGMAVPGRPGFHQLPFHTPTGSFTVVYTFDDDSTTCIALREVPAGVF